MVLLFVRFVCFFFLFVVSSLMCWFVRVVVRDIPLCFACLFCFLRFMFCMCYAALLVLCYCYFDCSPFVRMFCYVCYLFWVVLFLLFLCSLIFSLCAVVLVSCVCHVCICFVV